MRPATAANTVRALIASLPEERLRELVVELLLAALRCLAVSPGASKPAVPTGNGRRHRWSPARRAAENAKRREKRRAAQDDGPKRRGRKPKADVDGNGNGNGATANGRSAISAAALWQHASKLDPNAPWRVVARELGIAEAVAQAAMRDGILPCTPRAAARFMTL